MIIAFIYKEKCSILVSDLTKKIIPCVQKARYECGLLSIFWYTTIPRRSRETLWCLRRRDWENWVICTLEGYRTAMARPSVWRPCWTSSSSCMTSAATPRYDERKTSPSLLTLVRGKYSFTCRITITVRGGECSTLLPGTWWCIQCDCFIWKFWNVQQI